ncbi:MAG: GNAT family N-acetyltransferase [Candidatus Hermodarchaeota archaeon]
MEDNIEINIEIAKLEDASGVNNALKQNLIEIHDFDKIPQKQRQYLENHGFLRKEVDTKYYEQLIQDPTIDIYVAKNMKGDVIAFASIYKNQCSIYNFRTTLDNLYTNDISIREFLTLEDSKFVYLDQISVIPEYKRKGVGKAIFKKILKENDLPIVAFIVEAPLANKASARWHEHIGFELGATCDGKYKGKKFEWSIYIHWNNKIKN